MCSGLRDAANLAWKLDLVLADKAPEALLDTYASERVPHVAGMIEFSMALGRVICIADPDEAAARDRAMTAAILERRRTTPPPPLGIGPGVVRANDPHAGQLFVQGRVRSGGRTGLFDDVVGHGWTLLGRASDPAAALDRDTAAFFASLGGVTACATALDDVDGVYGRWFDGTSAAVVLQRPDFYVFGTAVTVDGARMLVGDLRRTLACRTNDGPR
jgi:3-(3-hydroxy-phenyl)propionate hydroxylase